MQVFLVGSYKTWQNCDWLVHYAGWSGDGMLEGYRFTVTLFRASAGSCTDSSDSNFFVMESDVNANQILWKEYCTEV